MAVAISWWKPDNMSQWTKWEIGTVDAGNTSKNDTFLIWNNRGGSSAMSNAEECTLTTKDIAGGDTGELVTEKWIWAKVDTMGETGYSAIGGATTKAIKAGGTAPAGTISGAANDGTVAASANNFAQVTLQARPSVTATAGNVDFLLRLTYLYR